MANIFLLALFVTPAAAMGDSTQVVAATSAKTPIEKVVKLIEELKANLLHDEKVDQQIHDKFACWCHMIAGHKAAAIMMAHHMIKSLSSDALSLKSEIAVLAKDISDKSDEIAEAEENIKSATAIRKKNNEAYMTETGDLMQAINALQRAMEVLSGAGTKTELLQNGEGLSSSERARAANFISVAVNKMPTDGDRALSPKKVSALARFTEVLRSDREEFEDKSTYAPQSATIQGILKDMYDSFSSDLESQTQTEAEENREFESLLATKNNAIATAKDVILKREEKKAELESELADTLQELEATQKQMAADIEFFDLTDAKCRGTHEEWVTRSEMRMEEIKGVQEALDILTSDENRALFAKAIKPGKETSFLQMFTDDDETGPAAKAYKVLKDHAKASHSLRLASLAAAVRTAGFGHFDEVIKAIDEVIATLKKEEQEDIKQRDFCKEELHKNSEQQLDLKWKIETNEAMITKLEAHIAKLEEDIQATSKEIADTKDQIEKMTDERTAEHEAFKEAKSDDEAAIEVLGQAIAALSKYYEKNKVDMGPIQGSMKLLQDSEPVFEVAQTQAPDVKFADAGKRKNQSKGIISILTMIKEDLEDEVKNGVKDEVASQAEFEKQVAAAEALIKQLEEKNVELRAAKAETEEQKELEHSQMKENKQSLDDKVKYRESIQEGCDWLLKSFQERVEKRKAEMDGLVTAKEYLTGAAPPAMLETSKAFDDDQLSEINFHGISFLHRH